MLVGFLGTIPFIASRSTVRTFDNYQKKAEARWSEHSIIGKKPVLEFNGPGLEEITFDMLFKADLGVNPDKEVEKLAKLRDNGTVVDLVLGNKVIGDNFWVVQNVSQQVTFWSKFGHPLSMSVSVTLKEYVDDVPASLGAAYGGLLS